MIKKGGVHRLSHSVVAAERERDIAQSSANLTMRQMCFNPSGGVKKRFRVRIVLLDPGGNRKYVWIENDIFRREANLIHQYPIRPGADLSFAFERVGLSFFVERHHDNGSTVAAHQLRVGSKLSFALLQTDRINDAFTLNALQASLQHGPFGTVHHDRQS